MHSELSDVHGNEIRASYQRTAKGYVNITESDPQGRFIVIENEHRAREETMNDWMLKRKCDGKYEVTFKFPADFMLKPRQRVTIWARCEQGNNHHRPPDEFLHPDANNFGTGTTIETKLYNAHGEERATFNQRMKTVN